MFRGVCTVSSYHKLCLSGEVHIHVKYHMTDNILVPYWIKVTFFIEVECNSHHTHLPINLFSSIVHTILVIYPIRLYYSFGKSDPKLLRYFPIAVFDLRQYSLHFPYVVRLLPIKVRLINYTFYNIILFHFESIVFLRILQNIPP